MVVGGVEQSPDAESVRFESLRGDFAVELRGVEAVPRGGAVDTPEPAIPRDLLLSLRLIDSCHRERGVCADVGVGVVFESFEGGGGLRVGDFAEDEGGPAADVGAGFG